MTGDDGEYLAAVPTRLPDPGGIWPREWLYGTRLVRKYVTLLAAPGGVGKSAYAIGQAICVATGTPYLGETVHHRAKVWLLNLEDPLEEIERRVAAFMIHHKVPRSALEGHLFLHSGRDRRLTMAASDVSGNSSGGIVYPDRDALIIAARRQEIGLIIVDPFIKSHMLDENSNPQMDAAATAWAEVAQATGAAVQLVHHVRKAAPGTALDIDAARGAKSVADAARVGLVMQRMNVLEAQQLGIAEAERWRYVRLDDAKTNMAPMAEKAVWFRLESVNLNNGNPLYPQGNNVATLTRFNPATLFSGLSVELCNKILDAIDGGLQPGVLYAARRKGLGNERWAGHLLINRFDVPETKTQGVINAWLRTGLLTEQSFHDPQQRKTRLGIAVNHAKRPTMSRSDEI